MGTTEPAGGMTLQEKLGQPGGVASTLQRFPFPSAGAPASRPHGEQQSLEQSGSRWQVLPWLPAFGRPGFSGSMPWWLCSTFRKGTRLISSLDGNV